MIITEWEKNNFIVGAENDKNEYILHTYQCPGQLAIINRHDFLDMKFIPTENLEGLEFNGKIAGICFTAETKPSMRYFIGKLSCEVPWAFFSKVSETVRLNGGAINIIDVSNTSIETVTLTNVLIKQIKSVPDNLHICGSSAEIDCLKITSTSILFRDCMNIVNYDQLKNIVHLTLDGTNIDDVSFIESLPLITLQINRSKISSIPLIATLEYLSTCYCTNLTDIRDYPSLKTLDISYSSVRSVISTPTSLYIDGISSMKIDLDNLEFLSAKKTNGLKTIGNSSKLMTIVLNNAKISSNTWNNLISSDSIHRLHINGLHVDGKYITDINADLSELTEIDLSGSKVIKWEHYTPHLKKAILSNMQDEFYHNSLVKFRYVKHIEIRYTLMPISSFEFCEAVSWVEYLDITATNIDKISGLISLKTLIADECNNLTEISNLPNLTHYSAKGCNITHILLD